MAANFFHVQELKLDKDEAHMLAESMAEVQKHYDIPMIDPKYAALGTMAATLYKVYSGKIIAIQQRKNAPRQAAAPPPAVEQPVVTLPEVEDWDIPAARPH